MRQTRRHRIARLEFLPNPGLHGASRPFTNEPASLVMRANWHRRLLDISFGLIQEPATCSVSSSTSSPRERSRFGEQTPLLARMAGDLAAGPKAFETQCRNARKRPAMRPPPLRFRINQFPN